MHSYISVFLVLPLPPSFPCVLGFWGSFYDLPDPPGTLLGVPGAPKRLRNRPWDSLWGSFRHHFEGKAMNLEKTRESLFYLSENTIFRVPGGPEIVNLGPRGIQNDARKTPKPKKTETQCTPIFLSFSCCPCRPHFRVFWDFGGLFRISRSRPALFWVPQELQNESGIVLGIPFGAPLDHILEEKR